MHIHSKWMYFTKELLLTIAGTVLIRLALAVVMAAQLANFAQLQDQLEDGVIKSTIELFTLESGALSIVLSAVVLLATIILIGITGILFDVLRQHAKDAYLYMYSDLRDTSSVFFPSNVIPPREVILGSELAQIESSQQSVVQLHSTLPHHLSVDIVNEELMQLITGAPQVSPQSTSVSFSFKRASIDKKVPVEQQWTVHRSVFSEENQEGLERTELSWEEWEKDRETLLCHALKHLN